LSFKAKAFLLKDLEIDAAKARPSSGASNWRVAPSGKVNVITSGFRSLFQFQQAARSRERSKVHTKLPAKFQQELGQIRVIRQVFHMDGTERGV
jgi:hypothetical protein